jgi:hypothetical protein
MNYLFLNPITVRVYGIQEESILDSRSKRARKIDNAYYFATDQNEHSPRTTNDTELPQHNTIDIHKTHTPTDQVLEPSTPR